MYRNLAALNGLYDTLFCGSSPDGVEGTQLFLAFCLYRGEFRGRLPHGAGVFLSSDVLVRGQWREGNFIKGTVGWCNGAQYEGSMDAQSDYLFERGTLTLECGVTLSAVWRNGELVEGRLRCGEESVEIVFGNEQSDRFSASPTAFIYRGRQLSVEVQREGCEVIERWTNARGGHTRAVYKGIQIFAYEENEAGGDRLRSDLSTSTRSAQVNGTRTLWFPCGLRVDTRLSDERTTLSFPLFGDCFELSGKARFNASQPPEIAGFYIYKLDGVDYAIKANSIDELFKHSVIISKICYKKIYEGLTRHIDRMEELLKCSPESAAAVETPLFASPVALQVDSPLKLFTFHIATQLKRDDSVAVELFFGSKFRDVAEGFCEFHYDDGAKYRGFFQRGRRHGHGVEVTAAGEALIGAYEAGEPVGIFTRVLANGEEQTGKLERGGFTRLYRVQLGAVTVEGVAGDDGAIEGLATILFADGARLRCRVEGGRPRSQREALYFSPEGAAYEGELKVKEKMGFFANEDVLVALNFAIGSTQILD